MAGAILVVRNVTDAGVTPTNQAAAAQQEIPNSGGAGVFVHVKTNATAGGINLTFKNQSVTEGRANPDLVVAVPLSSERIIGPFPRGIYNLADGNVQLNIDTPANVSLLDVYQMNPAG